MSAFQGVNGVGWSTTSAFLFYSDRYERTSSALTTNLDGAHWTEVFGHEQMAAALLDRLVHRSHLKLFDTVSTSPYIGGPEAAAGRM